MSSKKSKQKTPVSPPDFWENLSNAKKHLISLLFLFALPVILFQPTVLGGQQYMGHDTIQWRAGAESLIDHREETGEIAHWASNMFSGMPATTISHPPQISNLDNTLLNILDVIYPAAEMWILFGGAYLMFILLGARPLAAVFGSIIIGFTTYIPIIIGAGHNAKFLAYIYIPWLYSGYFLFTRKRVNPWLAMFLFAWALTLHLRAYHPQVTYFFLFPLGTLFIYDLVKAMKSGDAKPFAVHTGYLAGAAVISVLVVIQLYWSTFEYSSFSMRGGSELAGTSGLARDYAFAWSQGWGELLTLLIPGAYGGSELYWGPKSFTSGPHYFGALAFLFFVIGVIKSKHSLLWVFLGPGIATLFFSLGENFGALNNLMFAIFPLFDKFRVPEMWLMISIFCFSVPSVFGFDWLLGRLKMKTASDWKKPVYVAAGLSVIFIFIGFTALSFEKPGEREAIASQIASQNQVSRNDPRVAQTVNRYIDSELIPGREEMARKDTLRFGLMMVAGTAIIFGMALGKMPISLGAILICIIMAYDLISVDKQYMNEGSLVDGSLSREDYIERNERELDRYLQENVTSNEGWNYRVLPMLDNPFNNAIPAYFYPSAGGYSGAKLGYYQDVIDEAFFSGSMGINPGILSMLNIRYLSIQSQVDLPGFQTVYTGEDGVVMENLNVLPKAWFVDSVEQLESERDVLQSISRDFDPVETAFVAVPEEINAGSDTTSDVRITTYNPNQITLNISRNEPGFLVLGEIWYPPGWTATLNGEPVQIHRTNYILRGFEIPEGEHELDLKLEPVWYSTGRILSFSGSILLLVIGFFGLFLQTKRGRDDLEQTPEK
jgi:hypothetical protein